VLKALLAALPVVLYLLVAAYIAYTVVSFYVGYFGAAGSNEEKFKKISIDQVKRV